MTDEATSVPKIDIRPDHWVIVRDILHRHVPQYEVWAFGSRAKWTAKQYSDLDLAVITDKPLALAVSAALSDDFSESDLPWKVDVVDWATTSESFRKIIERDRVMVQKAEPNQAMTSEWRTLSLAEIYEFSSGLSKPRSEFGAGYPFLSFKDVFYHSAVPKQLTELAQTTEQERARCSVKRGDVFLTRTSETMEELGMSSVALADAPDATFNGFTKRLRPKQALIAPEFARYFFRSPKFRIAITAMSSMSTRASLNNEILERLTISFPSYEDQEAIGSVLCALDDKIELNRRTNETLEAMARALFKSWFVDFDGVAVEDMQESELGLIPKGWRVGALGDVSIYLSRGISPKYAETGGVLVLNQKCIRDSSIDASKARRHDSSQRGVDGRLLQIGDALVNSTGVGTLGRVAQVLGLDEPTIVDSHVTIVRAGPELNWPFLGQWFAHRQPEIEAMGEGSTGQTELSRSKLADMRIVIPDRRTLKEFDGQAEPMLRMLAANHKESQTLTHLRDTLLPKLLSGELWASDAERIAQSA